MLKSGDILVDRYRIVRPIARGGMGAVYEARDERLKRTVALKETLISENDLPRAFEHEAMLLANLNHPALPKVFDHFSENDGQYIIMEFIPGDDLGKLLEQRGEPFSITEIERWYGQLLDALEYLHAHTIIHRDLKPANLKVKNDGGIVMLDFGLAKGSAGQMTHHTSHQSVLGYTPIYAPLEQIRCEGTSPSSDLYSLAATMYHLLTNIAPVDAQKRELSLLKTGRDPLPPLAEVRPDLPPQLADMLTQALKLEPQDRPVSAASMRITSSLHGRPLGQAIEPPNPLVDLKEQPTILTGHLIPRADKPTVSVVESVPPPPTAPVRRPVKLSLAIPAALALILLVWFAAAHISSNRTNVVATPSSITTLPLTEANKSFYGGIEIGSKGIKAIVLKVDASETKALMPFKSVNTTLMSGVAQTGKFSPEAMDDAAKTVKKLYTQMRDQYNVATERIHIIGSSGLKKPDSSDVDNKDELVKKVESATGAKMSFLDAEHEVLYSISGTVPSQYLTTGILVDIGSGNTKGGYQESNQGDERFITMNVPFGTVSFTDEITKQGGKDDDFAQQAERLRAEILLPALRQELGRNPGLVNRRLVYLSGGIVWAMTTLLHPANREAEVKITAEDISTFANRALSGDKSLLNPNLSGIADEKTRQEVEEEQRQIIDTFSPQNLIAGAELLQAVSGEFKLKEKEVSFSRYNSMGWGWLLTYVKSEAAEEKKNNDQGSQ